MGFSFVTEIPSPDVIRERFPLAPELAARKKERDEEIKKIITGESDKLLVVVGPCSADNEEAVVDYVSRLVKVQEKTKDRLVIVPRVYTNKPRTTGEGYMGMIHQPDPEKKPDMLEGILAIRHMHMRVLQETGFSTADEMLYPENLRYLSDIMSYIAVGARSVENQFHRLVASGCDVPVGLKNPTSGDLTVMLNSVVAAQVPHDFIFRGWEVQCPGNPLSHTILRGAVNKHGQTIPNYHYEDLRLLYELYMKRNLKNPACIVDTNHSNSGKQPAPTPSAGSYILPDSAARRLTQADVANLTWEQCCLARNEIFARHGRIFQTPQIAAYFEAQSWYHGTVPGASFDNNSLSPTERANADFLANYENATWGHSYY